MAFLARLGEVISDTARKVQETVVSANEKRTLTVHIVNSTRQTLTAVQDYPGVGCACTMLEGLGPERTLPPGHAGAVLLSGPRAAFWGAAHLKLGDEMLVIGASFQAGIKRFRAELGGKTAPQDFVLQMPVEVMGSKGSKTKLTQGKNKSSVAFVLEVTDDFSEVQVVLTEASRIRDLEVLSEIGGLDGLQLLLFAEWCLLSSAHKKAVSGVLFLAEFLATERGMAGCRIEDQAYALDMLVAAFITSGALVGVPKDSFAANLREYAELPGGPPVAAQRYEAYVAWAKGAGAEALGRRILAGRSLLRAASLQCAAACAEAFQECKDSGTLGEKRSQRARELGSAFNDAKADAVSGAASGKNAGSNAPWTPTSKEEALALAVRAANEGRALTEGALQSAMARLSTLGGNFDTSSFIKELVGFCISTSTDFAMRRAAAYAAAAEQLSGEPARLLAAFAEAAPLLRRTFEQDFMKADEGKAMEVRFETFSSEVWGGAPTASPQEVLESLGRGAEDLEGMTTNSMSGEFFFQSRDGRFFVKTISDPEGELLKLMAPAYKLHLQKNPRSLINRYAGLFLVEAPGLPPKYFMVMRSVFDPAVMQKADEVYDLKGSLVNRKKKPGQSVGKDEDWVLAGDARRLQLPADARRELCAAHAEDLKFLLDFGVMDYSVLLGTHKYPSKQPEARGGWRDGGGLWSEDGDEIYFVGIIDHLVRYDLGRGVQNLREGDNAEIVRPDKYAARQVTWFRDNVVSKVEPSEDFGTGGRLTVSQLAGHEISRQGLVGRMVKAGSGMGMNIQDKAIAPYVTATIGLRSASTEVVENTASPNWGAWPLHLMVDAADCAAPSESLIEIQVRHRTHAPVLKGDDVLGTLRVKLRDVMQAAEIGGKPLTLQHKRLEDCADSELSVQLHFQAAPSAPGSRRVEELGIVDSPPLGENQCGCVVS